MNWLQQLLRSLVGNQPQTGANPSVFDELKKTRPAKGQVDPNLALILASQQGRPQRDTQGNYIMPGSKSFFQGSSGIDAYKEMNRNNTGSSIPGFNSGSATQRSMGDISEKLTAYKSQNPNEVLTGDAVRRILSNPVARRPSDSVVTTFQPGEKFEVVGKGKPKVPVLRPPGMTVAEVLGNRYRPRA